MSRAAFLSTLTWLVAAGLLAASSGWSAEPPVDAASAAAVSAQTLQSEGRSVEAVQMLDDQRGKCGAGTEGQTCRQIIDYSKGYVLQQGSAASAKPPTIAISSRSNVKTPLTSRNSPEERPGTPPRL